jgi:predicted ArsR family transcriptional regulator
MTRPRVTRRERILRTLAAQLARELGITQQAAAEQLQEGIDAGLLRVTRNGVQATIPGGDQ